MAKSKAKPTPSRIDVAFIRKSTQGQDEKPQIENVRNMLKSLGVSVPGDQWFVGTVSRRKVKSNPRFNELLDLIGEGRVGTVYIESQDRWGTTDRVELFHLLGLLRQHDTRLYDLRDNKDLTERDFATEMMAVLGSFKSEKELKDLSYRTMRSKVNNFVATGSWFTGPHPFGYGKKCFTTDGKVLWEFQPISKSKGQCYYPNEKGTLVRSGPPDAPLPRKARGTLTYLVPSRNKEHVESVRLVFDLFARMGESRRKIAQMLNEQGRKFYDKEFSHSLVTLILNNAAYVGDTQAGKTQTGEMTTFKVNGKNVDIVEVKHGQSKRKRPADERPVKRDTHDGLIDRKTWKLAQDKLKSQEGRKCFAPRNPAYYLKEVLVCGHCGKGMTGRPDRDQKTGEKIATYVCQTWYTSLAAGQTPKCGMNRITHADAEKMLFDKIKQENLRFDQTASELARASRKDRINRKTAEWEETQQLLEDFQPAAEALIRFIQDSYGVPNAELKKLRLFVDLYYTNVKMPPKPNGLSLSLHDFKKAVHEIEGVAVQEAEKKLVTLHEKHKRLTLALALETDLSKQVLKAEKDAIEQEINSLKPKTERLSDRLGRLFQTSLAAYEERKRLIAEWPNMENREKGEALRRLFNSVTLYWERTFRQAEKNPSRPRKTKRKGRWSYKLLKSKIKWGYDSNNLGSSL